MAEIICSRRIVGRHWMFVPSLHLTIMLYLFVKEAKMGDEKGHYGWRCQTKHRFVAHLHNLCGQSLLGSLQ